MIKESLNKNENKFKVYSFYFYFYFFLMTGLCTLFLTIPNIVFAQSLMSGGGYTLNGSASAFTGDSQGAEFILGPAGDPITGSGSESGEYTLESTPYYTVIPSETGGGGESPDSIPNSGGQASGAGFIFNKKENTIFKPLQSPKGIEWIDYGNGVDTNQDGVPDIYAPYSAFDNTVDKNGKGIAVHPNTLGTPDTNFHDNASPANYSENIKIFSNDARYKQLLVLLLYALLYVYAPVVRGFFPYKISRSMGAIFIETIIALHKDLPLRGIVLRSRSMEVSELKNGSQLYYFALFFIDTLLMPLITVFGALYIWMESPFLSLILLVILALRFLVGELLTRGHK